jgi:hypothetical protein
MSLFNRICSFLLVAVVKLPIQIACTTAKTKATRGRSYQRDSYLTIHQINHYP